MLLPLAGRKSFGTLARGDADRSAPSYVLLGFQPEGQSKQSNAITARERNCKYRHYIVMKELRNAPPPTPHRGKSVKCGMIFVLKVK